MGISGVLASTSIALCQRRHRHSYTYKIHTGNDSYIDQSFKTGATEISNRYVIKSLLKSSVDTSCQALVQGELSGCSHYVPLRIT